MPQPIFRIIATLFLSFLVLTTTAAASEFTPTPSLQGYTGLLNIPNALVTPEGRLDALFTNQTEEKWRGKIPRQENYLFSVGFFSLLEMGGRLTEAPGKARDLAGNFKLSTAPLFTNIPLLPVVAIGIQDIGGGSPHLRTKYAVVSETVGPLRLSVGYGTGPDRMKGMFAGAELQALSWLHLLAEYDTTDTNIGLRLLTPPLLAAFPVQLQGTLKTSLDYQTDQPRIAIGFRIPLGSGRPALAPIALEPELNGVTEVAAKTAAASPGNTATNQSSPPTINTRLGAMRHQLEKDGFLNVRIGTKGSDLLAIEYENSRFNHNELDAMGLIIGRALTVGQPTEQRLRLIVLKRGLRVMMLEAPATTWRSFLTNAANRELLSTELQISTETPADPTIAWEQVKPTTSDALKAEAILYPGLLTFIGTDVGTFDYYLSLKTDAYLSLWPGAVLNSRINTPISWSSNLDDGQTYRNYRNNKDFERLMLIQATKLAPDLWLSVSGGMILHRMYGSLNEAVWAPGDGTHRFRLKQIYAEQSETKTRKEVYIGSYRYRYAPLDVSLEAAAGRFYDQDKGFTLELKRFFGDTAFAVYYKSARATFGEDIKVGGVTLSFPLTPRRDMRSYPLRLRGIDEWGYSQETEITSPGKGGNWVGRSIGLNPQMAFSIERVFQNRDRLNPSYIRQHLMRLRDAWITYGN